MASAESCWSTTDLAPHGVDVPDEGQVVQADRWETCLLAQEVDMKAEEGDVQEGFGEHDPSVQTTGDGTADEQVSEDASAVMDSLRKGSDEEEEVSSRVAKRPRVES